MATMTYGKELTAIQTWVKSVAGLPSWKLKEAPTKLPRPVIIWETPSRTRTRNVSRYEYVTAVQQYGRLCVSSVEDALTYQDQLLTDLEERCGVIPVMEGSDIIRKLRNVQLEFMGQDLEGGFTLSYEVTYYRQQPDPVPHATKIINTVRTDYEQGV